MKKIIFSSLLLTSLFSAGFEPSVKAGGFVGAGSASIMSVKEALKLKDDANVVLMGNIISQIKSEHYNFKDSNGDIIEIEIDDHLWGNITADENTRLKIFGKIDKDFTKTSIDVKRIELLK